MKFKEYIKFRSEFRREVIRSNSGLSSKSYVMLEGIFLTRIIVFWYLAMQTIEMFTNYVLRSNWIDFVAVMGALSVFVLASAWGKVKGEQSYYNKSEWVPDEPMILDKDTESTESNEVVG